MKKVYIFDPIYQVFAKHRDIIRETAPSSEMILKFGLNGVLELEKISIIELVIKRKVQGKLHDFYTVKSCLEDRLKEGI